MKEENFDSTRPDRVNEQPRKTSQPFNPSNESRSDRLNEHNPFVPLSKPPKRDVSGRRVDVDDSAFGIELW